MTSNSNEQRISSSANSNGTIRPNRPPSISSLRHNRFVGAGSGAGPSSRSNSIHRQQPQTHSRRQSIDTLDSNGYSQPPSPITYFPNPSTFQSSNSSLPQPPSSSSTSPLVSTTSMSNSVTSLPEEQEFDDYRPTPRMSLVNLDSTNSSPRMTRGGNSSNLEHRRRSSGAQLQNQNSLRAFPTPLNGYGSTNNNAGLGLNHNNPSISNLNKDGTLSSPRRISTSRVPPPIQPTHRSTPPQGLLNLPTHEAYYSASQPGTATTSRFRDKDLAHPHTAIPQSNSNSLTAQTHMYNSSSSSSNSHKRHLSVNSNINSPLFPNSLSIPKHLPQSPTGSVMRRIRRTASTIGMGFGRPDNYDDVNNRGSAEDEMLEDDEGERANGTRVWYR